MADQVIRPDLMEKLQEIARREKRPLDDLVEAMISHYPLVNAAQTVKAEGDQQSVLREQRLRTYERARRYWRNVGNMDRAELTDEDLDTLFWLFDSDGIPRLRLDQNSVNIPDNSLYRLGQAAKRIGFRSGHSDIATRSREILENEFTEYMLSRRRDQTDATE